MKLPSLRDDISVAFNDYDNEGQPQWLIHDSGRNKFFLIGWQEYEIFIRWKMGDPAAIIQSVNNETTLHIDEIEIDNFIKFLKRNYLIKLSGHEIKNQAEEQKLFKTDSWIHWLIGNYLFFRIPLVKPNNFLTKTKFIADFVFSRYLFYVMSALAMIALYQLSVQWEQFTHTFSSIFNLRGLIFSMLAFVICKLGHELGHAYMCKQYDVPVPTLGVAFLVFWPVLYTDTTLSWSLNYKQRMRIALAGIWVETYLSIIAALIWCNTSNQTLQTICYVTISINWMASVLINVSPFMRFDGYYVLADYLKMPNLQPRAFALTRWQIRKWLFDWQDPPPEKFSASKQAFLILYSIITWIYRLIIYFGIAILVYHFFAKIVGIILFLIEMYYFILGPFINEIQTWISMRDHFSWNLRTKITVATSSILTLLIFIPINETISLPATISYSHQFLFAPESGVLVSQLPPIGTEIQANKPIALIESASLDQALLETRLEYSKTVSQLRRAAVNTEFTDQTNILISDLKRLKSEYAKLLKTKEKLTLTVSFTGILAESATDIRPGTYIMKGQWLGDVIKPASILIEAFASQIDVNLINNNSSGYFYPHDSSLPKIPVKIVSLEAINAKQLDCQYSTQLKQQKGDDVVVETPCYNASDLGGDVPAYQSDEGGYIPTTSVYRVLFSTDTNITLRHVERGTVNLKSRPRSYAYRFIYKVKSILVEELGF